MGEVVPARTSPTLLPHPLALCCHYPASKCRSASIVVTSTVRVNASVAYCILLLLKHTIWKQPPSYIVCVADTTSGSYSYQDVYCLLWAKVSHLCIILIIILEIILPTITLKLYKSIFVGYLWHSVSLYQCLGFITWLLQHQYTHDAIVLLYKYYFKHIYWYSDKKPYTLWLLTCLILYFLLIHVHLW